MPRAPIRLSGLLDPRAPSQDAHSGFKIPTGVLDGTPGSPEGSLWQDYRREILVIVAVLVVVGSSLYFFDLRAVITALPGRGPQIAAKGPRVTAYSRPVRELMEYVEALKQGRVAFDQSITGERAAQQHGFSRLFASAYEEVLFGSKARETGRQDPVAGDIASEFDAIVREEQAIDQLIGQRERHAAAIAYLRALQNGDVVFPGPQVLAPTPAVLLAQLLDAYPDVEFDINDRAFAAIYRDAREFASARMNATQQIWASEIISEFRRLVLQSAAKAEPPEPPTLCEKGKVIGHLLVVMESCPLLRLNQAAQRMSEEVAKQQEGKDCREKASVSLKAQFRGSPAGGVEQMCDRIAREVLAGKNNALEMVN